MRFKRLREKMVATQIEGRGIRDPRVLDAMRKVPRHLFVGEALQDQAYGDFPLPIGEGQTISQPFIVAEMTQALQISPDDRILEIGTGSGYQTAILAELADRVYTIERLRSLFINARRLFDQLKYYNIVAKCSDGTRGWQDEAPFDGIIVTAGSPRVLDTLIGQLTEGGTLVVPVGGEHAQELMKITKRNGEVEETSLGGCRFVKLIGNHGWQEA